MISKQNIHNICKYKCNLIVPKCRHIKKNNRLECYFFRQEFIKIKEQARLERYEKELSKREMFSLAEADFFDSKGDDITKREFFENEIE